MNRSNRIGIDAVPQQMPISYTEIEVEKLKIENLVSEFSPEDYKAAFFLLMDFVEPEKYFRLTQETLPNLKKAFISLYCNYLNESHLVELFGTLKMYKKLRMLGTCFHVYENKEKYNDRIHGLWKMLYSLSEELTDEELDVLKQHVEDDCKHTILSAEDWFCWAFRNSWFSKTNVSCLEVIFREYPKCIKIIKSYEDFGFYNVRRPTAKSDCGIALIFNYEIFSEKGLENRKNSHKDVASLKLLWDTFGFQVRVYENLTYLETFKEMKKLASMNYSQYDVFVCNILSHGDSKSIYSVDGVLMEITDLIKPVVNCIGLKKKPKLFFIQACQGPNIYEKDGKSIYRLQTSNEKPAEKFYSSPPPVFCDTLKVNSSIDGYVSFNDERGSWFIQSLCKQMMQEGEKTPIEEVMTLVQQEVQNKYTANLESFGPSGAIEIVVKDETFSNLEPLRPSTAGQIVNRNSTLSKKLILRKRIT